MPSRIKTLPSGFVFYPFKPGIAQLSQYDQYCCFIVLGKKMMCKTDIMTFSRKVDIRWLVKEFVVAKEHFKEAS